MSSSVLNNNDIAVASFFPSFPFAASVHISDSLILFKDRV
jgi:hypothetical protein